MRGSRTSHIRATITKSASAIHSRTNIASTTPRVYGVGCARFAPSLLTSPADVEAFLRAVRALT
jgi:selenocysteine lyase/cysteine desulfurase